MERNPYRSMYQYCACCGKWTANYADGAGRCADGIYDRSDDGLYRCDRQSCWMYTSAYRKAGRSGSGDHGNTSDFNTGRYQHDQRILCNCQCSISVIDA